MVQLFGDPVEPDVHSPKSYQVYAALYAVIGPLGIAIWLFRHWQTLPAFALAALVLLPVAMVVLWLFTASRTSLKFNSLIFLGMMLLNLWLLK